MAEVKIAVGDQVRGAKLDRLSRDAHCLFGVEKVGGGNRDGGMPSANRHTVWIMAMVADEERRMISKRTEEALAVAKAEGKRLGGNRGNLPVIGDQGRIAGLATRQAKAQSRVADLAPVIEELRAAGAVSLRQIAAGLNAKGITAARGGPWTREQVRRVLERATIID
jgi:DNA invertase Pin-like site-specific DNA recombinase